MLSLSEENTLKYCEFLWWYFVYYIKEKYHLSVQQFNSVYTFEQTDKVGMPFVKLLSNF